MWTVVSIEEHAKVGNGREESDERMLENGKDTTLSQALIAKVKYSIELNTEVK